MPSIKWRWSTGSGYILSRDDVDLSGEEAVALLRTAGVPTGQALFERYDNVWRRNTGVGVSSWEELPEKFRVIWNELAAQP